MTSKQIITMIKNKAIERKLILEMTEQKLNENPSEKAKLNSAYSKGAYDILETLLMQWGEDLQ
jgi:hypothetical protein